LRQDNESQRAINELKDLLLQQQDKYEEQMNEREKTIEYLNNLILENSKRLDE
jgi:hypothetical protein